MVTLFPVPNASGANAPSSSERKACFLCGGILVPFVSSHFFIYSTLLISNNSPERGMGVCVRVWWGGVGAGGSGPLAVLGARFVILSLLWGIFSSNSSYFLRDLRLIYYPSNLLVASAFFILHFLHSPACKVFPFVFRIGSNLLYTTNL
jgi:hypothetical protein